MPELTADEFSCEPCAACNHAKAFHRPNNGPCFGELNRNALSGSDIKLANLKERKEMGAECWCRSYEIDLARGIDAILKDGDATALVTATNGAVERADCLSAEKLLDRYVRKIQGHRDLAWVRATERSITRLQSQSNPVENANDSPSQSASAEHAGSQAIDEYAAVEKQRSHSQLIRPMSKAPAPIVPLRGSWKAHAPKATESILDWPPNYPNNLRPQTAVTIGEALKKFPVQTQMHRLCEFLISELTPYFCKAVRQEYLVPHAVLSVTTDLVHYLVVANCENAADAFRLEMEIKKSDEWLNLAKAMAKEVSSATKKRFPPNPKGTPIGRNINRLRKECGWSFNKLAERTGLEKKLILGHVNHGKGIRPDTLRVYVDAFAKKLERMVTVAELEII